MDANPLPSSVLNNEAFDYISNVEKGINVDGTVTYKVGMRRFYCPPPVEAVPELVTIKPMGNSVQDYRRAPNRAYQAVDGEDVVVEEVIAQEGVEVPDTTEESDEDPVRVITGEEKRLDDLKVNDWVQTLKGAENKLISRSNTLRYLSGFIEYHLKKQNS
ncbi:hypothetical protein TELCIR_14384 [Teladorsagia circumcincta]|uniref:Uncharacterized protein n=1 Tax=Teladorsagia circumcincta TaxID=45464 RepID=A0A2G9U157_TELCI|nr:hypothetical protein TELCIR_14384 [Teladorsagia circumcincta]